MAKRKRWWATKFHKALSDTTTIWRFWGPSNITIFENFWSTLYMSSLFKVTFPLDVRGDFTGKSSSALSVRGHCSPRSSRALSVHGHFSPISSRALLYIFTKPKIHWFLYSQGLKFWRCQMCIFHTIFENLQNDMRERGLQMTYFDKLPIFDIWLCWKLSGPRR